MQSIPLSQRALDAADELADAFKRASADGAICPIELLDIRARIIKVHRKIAQTDHARAISQAALKGGNCLRVRQLMADWPDDAA